MTTDYERADLSDQLRDAWEGELVAAGFRLIEAPTPGIAGLYRWELTGFDQRFVEGMLAVALLNAAEARLTAMEVRTASRIAALRAVVQRLARLQAIDWRIAIDAVLGRGSDHPYDRERRRADLWKQVTARGLPPRVD